MSANALFTTLYNEVREHLQGKSRKNQEESDRKEDHFT